MAARTIRFMIASFRLPIRGEILKSERFKQTGSFSRWSAFESRVPARNRGRKPVAQFHQLRNLLVEPGNLLRSHARDPSARRSARVSLSENPGKFRQAEACLQSAADRLNPHQRMRGIEPVPALRAQRLCQQPELFVIANRVRTDSRGSPKLAGGQYAIAFTVHRESSMNP